MFNLFTTSLRRVKYVLLSAFLLTFLPDSTQAQFISGGPQSGDVYKDYTINNKSNNNSWRVTDPDSPFVGDPNNSPGTFLPNPTISFNIDDYSNVERVELIMDVWGGHVGTTGKKVRLNGLDWIDIPELNTTPTNGQCYLQQITYVLDVPVTQLVQGTNTIQGTSGNQSCPATSFNWGQWGLYGAIVRVYYNSNKGHTTGEITSHATGDAFIDNPTFEVSPNGPVNRVEFIAKYDGYDVDGDGYYNEWVGDYHRTSWNDTIDINNHIGAATTAPYEITWNTEWVPDQVEGGISLMAKIKNDEGYWYVTDIVEDLTLYRENYSVKLYKPQNVGANYWVRDGRIKSSTVNIPTLVNATAAQAHIRTWNGDDPGEDFYTRVNGYELPEYGADHFYAYDKVFLPVASLLTGTNTFRFQSSSLEHGIEILWPGPAISIKYGSVPTAVAPHIITQPSNQSNSIGQSVTFSVAAAGSGTLNHQWMENGIDIPGADQSSYTISSISFDDDGNTYSCRITNSEGNVTSDAATLTVTGSGVRISNEFDEGIDCYKIETSNAIYYFDKAGGGLVSMIDNDGVDWISHNSATGSAGEYRGFPNSGELHPGYVGGSSSTSDALNAWQESVTIESSRNGESMTWEFFPTYVKVTLNSIGGTDNAYWILFEGTPGGAVGADDMVYLSDGTSFSANDDNPFGDTDITNTSGNATGSEWMYISDGTQDRSVYLAITDDNARDNYWQMEDNMTVFGFGRGENSIVQYRTDVGAEMVLGFVDSKQASTVESTIDGAWNGTIQQTLPLAPSDLQGNLISQSELQLTWVDNSDNENNFIVERKVNSGSFTVIETAAANATTFSDLTINPGNSYFYRVRAANSEGQSGNTNEVLINVDPEFSPTINVWYGDTQKFGEPGNPQEWINVLGNVQDSDGSVTALSYKLNGGPSVALNIGPDERRLQNAGDFNIDLAVTDLNDGINHVEITATDNNSNSTVRTVELQYSSGNTWNATYQVDWDTVTNIQNVVQVVDGDWEITANGLRTSETGYDRLVAVGEQSWTNYEVTVPITVNSLEPPISAQGGNEFGLGLLMRWTGHTDSPVSGWQPKSGWEPYGEIGWFNWDEGTFGNQRVSFLNAGITSPMSITTGSPYMFKFQVITRNNGDHRYNLKVWSQASTEPEDWTLTHDASSTEKANGSFMFIAHHVDATFGDFSVSPLTITLPADPSGLIVNQLNETEVEINWTDNSNNEEAFIIERRLQGGTYEELVIVDDGTVNYTDNTVITGNTYEYRVRAENAFGSSGTSNEVTLYVEPAPAAPSALTVTEISETEVQITWTDNSNNEDNFVLERRLQGGTYLDLDIIGADIEIYTDNSVVPGSTYQYRLRAENAFGSSGTSNEVTLYVEPAPTAPSALTATEISETEVQITWTDNSNNEDNFVLERRLQGGTYSDLDIIEADIEIYTDNSVVPGSTYQYRLRAENAFGSSGTSNEVTLYVEPAPVAPIALTATEISETEVQITWTDNSNNEDNFILERRLQGGTYSDLATLGEGAESYSDNSIVAGNTYQYRVRAENAYGVSATSNEMTIYVEPAPAAPSALTVTEISETEVQITWMDNSNNEDNFILERRLQGGTYSELAEIGAGVEIYSDNSVIAGNTYLYRIKALNAYGESTFSSEVSIYVEPAPIAPSNIGANEISETEVLITWSDNSNNENGFRLERRLLGGTFSLLTNLGSNVTNYSDETVFPAFTYEYRVRAENDYGVSGFSSIVSIYVEPSPSTPTNLTSTEITETEVLLEWDDTSDNEDNFVIERRLQGGTYAVLTTLGPNKESYSDNGVNPGSTYDYRLRAVNAYGESAYSNETTIYVEPAPTAPVNLSATEITETEILLEWDDTSDNEDNFVIERRLLGDTYTELITLGSDTENYSDNGVIPGSTYDYRLKAINTYGESSYSNEVTIYVEPAPTTPANLLAIEITETEVLLEWEDTSDNEDTFVIERRLLGGTYTELNTLGSDTESYSDNSVNPGSTYDYRLKAVNAYGESDYSSEVTIFVEPAPTTPINLSATEITETEVLLEWDDTSDNEDTFVLERRLQGGTFAVLTSLVSDMESYADIGVNPGSTYDYRVKAINAYGESSYSNEATIFVEPAPTAPVNLSATEITETEVLLEWDDTSDNEDNFVIERRLLGGAYTELITLGSETENYSDNGVSPGSTYDYRLKAINAYGESSYSNEVTIYVEPAPTTPVNLSATEITETEVLLEWDDTSDNEDSFVLERKVQGGSFVDLIMLDPNTENYTDNSVIAGNNYVYRIRAENVYGVSERSNEASTYVEPAPTVPTNLIAVEITETEVLLEWDDTSDNEDAFVIERRLQEGTYEELTTLGSDIESYSDNGVNPGSTYDYRMKAVNAYGESEYSNESSVFVEPAPNMPTNLFATEVSETEVLLEWDDNSDNETDFILERRIDEGTYSELANITSNTVSYLDSTVEPSKTYRYRLRADNEFGSSDFSNEVSIFIEPAPDAPSELEFTRVDENGIDLKWEDNSDNEDNFMLERRSVNGDFTEYAVLEPDMVTFTDTNIEIDSTYEYRLKAVNHYGDSEFSNVLEVTVVITGLIDLEQEITLFPNPMSDDGIVHVNLKVPYKGNLKYTVLNVNGVIIQDGTIELVNKSDKIDIDLSKGIRGSGIYFFVLNLDDEINSFKLLKQ